MEQVQKKETGEVMLEGMIVTIVTIMVLVWILGIGFVYYQKYVVRIATNDVAKKIAATYDAPTTDVIMGFIGMGDLEKKSLYSSPDLTDVNQERAEGYLQYVLEKANFYGTVKSADVAVKYDSNVLGRSHVAVTTKCTFRTPFGGVLAMFGLSEEITYSVTSYADATSLSEHISAITITNALTNGTFLAGTGFVEKTVNMLNSFKAMCSQLFSPDSTSPSTGGTNSPGGSSGGGFQDGDTSGGGGR